MELAESWDGSEGGGRLGTKQGLVVTSQIGKEGQGRPPAEADRLWRGEEEKGKKFVDWRAVKETGVREEDGEDLDEPSPRIKEGWRSKGDKVWDMLERDSLKGQLNAPRKEQRAVCWSTT
jgi:hypothetical protein